ncbi:bacillithiol biosynthesis cysteine-adding enzyme BshC [Aliifodinibius sp. S!AR15-10]|uniref:bacillithiol biosynthesis cysteine-adding enzyme BshC n=1 Tax=Aliifodinibius sp. S!AR15-10 TaxID=2950437 RepID=UPI002863F2F3|nr:bacillithiol biosynthesis cysteine-adding enzyme BshC [Aliifodinibius sp. S!AR15-10]MDR8392355.1 bacillithiol biosynthesis cysteine-adding enzyme BshC [Aliifodinibius sp. S!AR15-10]
MHLENYPFDKLPFTKLFRTYLSEYSELADYYSANPLDIEALKEHAEKITVPQDRDDMAELLKVFNRRFNLDEKALQNIERLKEDRSLALVTGQQLGVFGGPLFTIFKTVTTIHLAKELEEELERPVVPVFWLADEDHDYDEVKHVRLLDRDEVISYGLEYNNSVHPPVAELTLNDRFDDFKRKVHEGLFETDFSEDLWNLLEECYTKGTRMDSAFGSLISRLFSRHGLILAGSNCNSIKERARGCMKHSIEHADEIRQALDEQSSSLEGEFHQQATIYDSNLFYLDGEAGRTKILRNGSSWKTENGHTWSTEELLNLIDEDPESFSPNVFLRPILQDLMVPTLGYVAGPGELAYYGQMKKMYKFFKRSMPAIFPRMSATIIEPSIDRILDELPFEIADYEGRIEDLESKYVERSDQPDIEEIFNDWKQKVEEISEGHKAEIKDIDSTLEGAAGKATAVYFGELDKLKGKVYRSVKQQEETQIKRIRKIKANLFPEGIPQERIISFIYFMNKYGIDIWDRLLQELDEDEKFDQHKLIYL